jgi:hypothetical protein
MSTPNNKPSLAFNPHWDSPTEGGATNLEEVVAALNARGVKTPAGLSWSAQNYEAELARLGPAHPHTPAQAEPQPYPTPKP